MATVYPNTNKRIAKMAGLQPVIQTAAEGVRSRAAARAARHVDTGSYVSSLTIVKRGIDREVVADDPASTIIELGHLTPSGKWVPGQHILGGAVYGG